MKRTATGLLIFVTLLFFFARSYEKIYPVLGYLRAFSEAAMVGALADWFAVVALFKHPLGLPIPHTNLIKQNKVSLANNLGRFITENFLHRDTIKEQIKDISITKEALKWLSEPQNASLVTQQIISILPDLVESIDEKKMNGIVHERIMEFLEEVDLATLVAEVLSYVVSKEEHQKLLILGVQSLSDYLQDKQNMKWIYNKVREKSPKIIPNSIDDMYTKAFIDSVIELMEAVKNNKEHPIRQEFYKVSIDLIFKLRNHDDFKDKAQRMKMDFVKHEIVQNYLSSVWTLVKEIIVKDLASGEGLLKTELEHNIRGISERVLKDEEMVKRADEFIKDQILSILEKNKELIAQYISKTVQNWGDDLSDKIELQVGWDLQFIRINGTLVGGSVGLILYILFEHLLLAI